MNNHTRERDSVVAESRLKQLAQGKLADFSQPAHRGDKMGAYQAWILDVIERRFSAFDAEFRKFWATECTDVLYPKALFEDQDHSSDTACSAVLDEIWSDALRFCGIEMHRRCLSLAHNADFETIEDTAERARLEARNLKIGANLILHGHKISTPAALTALADDFNGKDFL